MPTTQTDRFSGAPTVAATTRVPLLNTGTRLGFFRQDYFGADYFAQEYWAGEVPETFTDRISGTASVGLTDRVSGTATFTLLGRLMATLELSGDMNSGNDHLLLTGDMTDGDDEMRLSGRVTASGTSTDRIS